MIRPRAECGYGLDAQWHDDFHHSLHSVLTGNRNGYLADFGVLEDLSKSITDGFVYDGKYSSYRRRRHGSSSKDRPGEQFVACIQNHDQIANACLGKRLSDLVSPEQQKLAAAVLLCSPFIPMIFMGQEYGETGPFLFFTSYGDPDLAKAVCEGRRREYEAFYSSREFPDPQSAATFEKSKLHWPLIERSRMRDSSFLSGSDRGKKIASITVQLPPRSDEDQRFRPGKMAGYGSTGPVWLAGYACLQLRLRQAKEPIGFAGTVWRLALWSYAPIS